MWRVLGALSVFGASAAGLALGIAVVQPEAQPNGSAISSPPQVQPSSDVPAATSVASRAPVRQAELATKPTSAVSLALRYSTSISPLTERVITKEGHIVCYNQATRNAVWVLQRLARRKDGGNKGSGGEEVTRENSQFVEDKEVAPKFRAKLSDYHKSGYDRGHLAPAGDFKPHLGGTQQMMDQTFQLTNISPQIGVGFNRDYWARFEMMVRDFTRSYDEVIIFTGGLFLPRQDPQTGKWHVKYEVIGDPPNVAVPTHFYKVILGVKKMPNSPNRQEILAVDSFVIPNQVIPGNVPIMTFRKRVDEVEQAAGVQFFDAFVTKNRICDLDPSICSLPKEDFWKEKEPKGKPKKQ